MALMKEMCVLTQKGRQGQQPRALQAGEWRVSVSNLTPSLPQPASLRASFCSVDLGLYPGAVMDTGRAKSKYILGFKTQMFVCGV